MGRKRKLSEGANSGDKGKRRILDGGEGGIRLERLCQVCCSLRLQRIRTEAANESRRDASMGADDRETGVRRRTRAM